MIINIHIGVHKTATTELQQALSVVRWRLERGGGTYLGPEELRGKPIALEKALRDNGEPLRPAIHAQLEDYLSRYKSLLLSEENILGTTRRGAVLGKDGAVYPAALKYLSRLLALLGDRDVQLFMAVRDPAQFITSTYGQQLRQLTPLHQDIYLRDFRLAALSWTDLAQRILSLPQVRRLTVWRYEDYGALRPKLLNALIGRRAALRVPAPVRVNSGISQQAYDTFVAAALADSETPTRNLLAAACRQFPKLEGVAPMRILPEAVYAESLQQYARDVAALAGLDRVRWLVPDDELPGGA